MANSCELNVSSYEVFMNSPEVKVSKTARGKNTFKFRLYNHIWCRFTKAGDTSRHIHLPESYVAPTCYFHTWGIIGHEQSCPNSGCFFASLEAMAQRYIPGLTPKELAPDFMPHVAGPKAVPQELIDNFRNGSKQVY